MTQSLVPPSSLRKEPVISRYERAGAAVPDFPGATYDPGTGFSNTNVWGRETCVGWKGRRQRVLRSLIPNTKGQPCLSYVLTLSRAVRNRIRKILDETHDVLLEARQLPKHGRYRVVKLDALTDPKVWYR